jgi:polar amino acid transport system substrate-binding protein
VPRPRLTRSLSALAAGAALALVAACGGGSSSSSGAQDNPYNLQKPGTLRIATLTDAPPNVFLKDGKFTGFDNDLMTAVAGKIGLKPEFVGTDFSALLAQVNSHKFDVGSSSITITEERKKTVDFTNGYDFGYFGLDVPAGSPIKSFDQLQGKRVVVVQGTVQDDYATKKGLDPVRVPDYNSALNQLRTKTSDAWIAPAEIGEKTAADSNGKVVLAAKELSPAPTAFAVAKGNDALREALNKALDQVIADGTWTKLQEQYYPGRAVPASFKPGSGTVKVPPVKAGTPSGSASPTTSSSS